MVGGVSAAMEALHAKMTEYVFIAVATDPEQYKKTMQYSYENLGHAVHAEL